MASRSGFRPEPLAPLRDLESALGSGTLLCVVAPAGSGKTTLLHFWMRRLEGRDCDVAYLDLDPLHQDAQVLAGDLRDAIAQSRPEFGQELERNLSQVAGETEPERLLLRAFRRDWAATSAERRKRPLVCVLDNYHSLEGPCGGDRLISQILRADFDGLSFAVASRGTLPSATTRLRAADACIDLGPEDLSLHSEEIRTILEGRGVSASEELVAQVLAQTEGWVTGVLLAARALERISESDRLEYVKSLAKQNDLFEYVAAEVLDDVDPELVQLVECASLLGRATPTELAAVTGISACEPACERAVERGLLLSEGSEVWPHQMWRDLLRTRLRERCDLQEWRELHNRIGPVLAGLGRPEEALEAFCEANSWVEASKFLVEVGPQWISRGRAERVREWLDRIPPMLTETQPALLWLRAAAILRQHPDQAAGLMERATDLYAARGNVRKQSELLGNRAAVLFAQGREDEARSTLRSMLRHRHVWLDASERAVPLTIFAGIANLTRRFSRSLRFSERALSHGPTDMLYWVHAMNRVLIHAMRGDLREALEVVNAALVEPTIRHHVYFYTSLRLQRGLVLALAGDLRGSLAEIERSMQTLEDFKLRRQLEACLRVLATLKAALGEHEEAFAAVRERLALHVEAGDRAGEASARSRLALHHWLVEDRDGAEREAERSLEIYAREWKRNRYLWPWDFVGALWVWSQCGHEEEALSRARRYERRIRQKDTPLLDHIALLQLHEIADRAGDSPRADRFAREAWEGARDANLSVSDPLMAGRYSRSAGESALRQGVAVDFTFDRMQALCPGELPDLLTTLLRDRSVGVRIRGVELCERLGGRTLHSLLQGALKDRSAKVREAAERAIPRLDLRPPYRLCIRSLGDFELSRGEDAVSDEEWSGSMPRRLLFRLLAAEGRMVARDEVVADLWPDADGDAARNNLRVALSRLNDALDPDRPSAQPSTFVATEGDRLGLDLDGVLFWDAQDFERADRAGSAADREGETELALQHFRYAVDLYRGELLPEARYDEWCLPWRVRLAERFRAVARRSGELLLALERSSEVHAVAHRLLAEDTADESGWELLMRAHLAAGDRTAAIRVFEEARASLGRHLEIEPGAALRRLRALAAADPAAGAAS